ncbi:carboxypeptidase y [Anaeramoeba ignava]|uniref:Carboxypeptidase y n=1 Tax=Anaeramoeba ignava TaxID=1746090 RepID=A0A9Q0RHR2_ANAIG|nr:carboxypeptidase y [Anaeramoeba ignava]
MKQNLLIYIIGFLFLFQLIHTHPKVIINNITAEEIYSKTETEIGGFRSYSGYITTNESSGANMFFIFVPSMDESAPVELIIAGGPGCASEPSLFLTIGPTILQSDGSFIPNRYSWTDMLNLLYIDNPVGAGYSYIDDPDGNPINETLVAQQLYNALSVFFDKFQIYKNNDFYIYGASYCGKYIPAIGYKIMQENFVIPLKGVVIGDGLTDPYSQMNYSYYSYATGLIGVNEYPTIYARELECKSLMQNESWYNATTCMISIWQDVVNMSGNVSLYDIRVYGEYNMSVLNDFMESNSTKEAFGVDPNTTWYNCNGPPIHYLYEDMSKSVKPEFEALLANGTKILLFTGQYDLIIDLMSTLGLLNATNWEYMDDFNNSTRIVWKVDGKVAGYTKNYKNLWYITLIGACWTWRILSDIKLE